MTRGFLISADLFPERAVDPAWATLCDAPSPRGAPGRGGEAFGDVGGATGRASGRESAYRTVPRNGTPRYGVLIWTGTPRRRTAVINAAMRSLRRRVGHATSTVRPSLLT